MAKATWKKSKIKFKFIFSKSNKKRPLESETLLAGCREPNRNNIYIYIVHADADRVEIRLGGYLDLEPVISFIGSVRQPTCVVC